MAGGLEQYRDCPVKAWFALCAHDGNLDAAEHWGRWKYLLPNACMAPVLPASEVERAGEDELLIDWAAWMRDSDPTPDGTRAFGRSLALSYAFHDLQLHPDSKEKRSAVLTSIAFAMARQLRAACVPLPCHGTYTGNNATYLSTRYLLTEWVEGWIDWQRKELDNLGQQHREGYRSCGALSCVTPASPT